MATHAYVGGALPAGNRRGRPHPSSPTVPLGLAALCLAALAATWVVAELVPAVQVKDSAALYHFVLLDRPHLNAAASALLHLLDPVLFLCWGVVLVAVALGRRRPRVALAVALVLALAPLSAEVLKPLLAHPHLAIDALSISAASWPSGHSTAALALGLCAVLVAPPRLRSLLTILALAFAIAIGCSLLLLAWHMPSDVFGGYLLAALWMALAVAGLRAAERRWPSGRGSLRRSGVSRSGAGAVGAGVPQ